MIYGYSFHQDGTIKGERDYCSYSALDLWRKSPADYRKRYYEGADGFNSPYTIFGTEVHKKVEDGDIIIDKHNPDEYEHEVSVRSTIGDVKMLGYIDMLHKDTKSVTDLKTSVNPWTQVMVQQLDQLPVYTLMLREHHDKVSMWVMLAWLETQWVEHGSGIAVNRELALTGKQQVFRRRLYNRDLERVEDIIKTTAAEIDKDFAAWRKEHKT